MFTYMLFLLIKDTHASQRVPINFENHNSLSVLIRAERDDYSRPQENQGALFTKQTDLLSQDLMKSRSREIRV